MYEIRRPDLKKDRFIVVQGGSLPSFTELNWIETPLGSHIIGKVRAEAPKGISPKAIPFKINFEVVTGTIDEIVEAYRAKLHGSVISVLGGCDPTDPLADGSKCRDQWDQHNKMQETFVEYSVNKYIEGWPTVEAVDKDRYRLEQAIMSYLPDGQAHHLPESKAKDARKMAEDLIKYAEAQEKTTVSLN